MHQFKIRSSVPITNSRRQKQKQEAKKKKNIINILSHMPFPL